EVVEAAIHGVVDGARPVDIAGAHEGGGCGGRPPFDEAQCLHGHFVLAGVDHGDLGTDVAFEVYEPFGFEQSDRFANGHDADVQFARYGAEHEPVPGGVVGVFDARFDEVVGEL